MPHPSVDTKVEQVAAMPWGTTKWGQTPWAGPSSGVVFTPGSQVVIRHDRSTTKKKRLRQRQRVR